MAEKRKILLVGSGDSIFLVNYVKSLKKKIDVEVSVYSPFPNNGDNGPLPYDEVFFDNTKIPSNKILKVLYFIFRPYLQAAKFRKEIKGKHYDIVHIHRLLPAWTLIPTIIRNCCSHLFLSFWGGEIDREELLKSHNRYLNKLERLIDLSDCIVGSLSDKRIVNRFPAISGKAQKALFGSSIIDILCNNNITPDDAKKSLNIEGEKITVLLGYSGKEIHNHLKILNEIIKNPDFVKIKSKIHFIASMTRGATLMYIKEVENALSQCGCSYTLIKNCYQSDNDVALLRKATDVFFQLSTSDYLSASVKENLCAGAIMISGDWLPYDILKNDGFYFIEADSIGMGVSVFYSIINNFDEYKDRIVANQKLCSVQYTWDACIVDWIEAYSNRIDVGPSPYSYK